MGKAALRLAAMAATLLTWQGLAWLHIWPDYMLPAPGEVAATIWRIAATGELPVAFAITFRRILTGFAVATVAGLLLGLCMSRSRLLAETVSPMVLALQALPSICWFPLAILWLGLNERAILFITVAGALFAVAAATESGIRNIPPIFLRAAATMGARGWRLYLGVVFPAALPGVVSGIRQGWAFAWRSLMAAELLFVNLGMGQLLALGRELGDVAQVMAVVLVILAVGLAVDRLVFHRAEQALRRRWGFTG